ncbi:MAG: Glu-tRNA(Gln) amidotransferase subunit GatD [Candidatus Thalassarchaeum sp.]|nr:Glu-tRNA(Gln) amidotransferase subunit GatD [Candidatus Thalassarchaeum sp.]
MGEWPEAGTPVKVAVKTWSGVVEHEGLTLPAAGPKLITLKLANGYNVSYPESYVESVEILDEVEISEEEAPTPIEQDGNLPLVHLIHTGGTIASKVDYATGAVTARFEPDELLQSVPELKSVARLRVVKLGNMFSDDIRPRHWNRMLKATEEAFAEGAVGVVITHGTDTLHLSAAAMGYGWAGNGGRPPGRIALTGSQRSPDRGSSDAAENLVAAVHWAAHGPEPTGYRDASVVVMHSESSDGQCAVLPGIACRKYHSSRRDAFKAINQGPLAWINNDGTGPSIEMAEHEPADARVEAISPMMFNEDARIAQFIADPHLDPNLVMLAIKDGFDAIVLHGTGLGHLPISDPQDDSPENTKLRLMLEDHCSNGGVVVVVAQTIHGPMNLNVYAKGREQQDMGVIGHGSLCPPSSALVKLHHLLSRGGGQETVASNWTEDLCGENPHDSMD